MKKEEIKNDILLYEDDDNIKVEVIYEDENVWLTQLQLVELFKTTKPNISMHIKNIFIDEELDKGAVVKNFLTTASDGKKYKMDYYNLDYGPFARLSYQI